MAQKTFTITLHSSFKAKHWHDGALNEPMHEHNFKYEAVFGGHLNKEGYIADFREIEEKLKEINLKLEGKDLNIILRYPTAENLASYLFDEIQKSFPQLVKIIVQESENYYAS
ncbi:MAG: 6-carboxytetrahydropterin synthase, partial [Elusimicrobiota bacterium]|nr:6-carboxytetrahydropterin synthase [Elusimicrobiota bacterium]